ncbi:M18 family aminopeptidase [Brooklawnia cerclae]|uniref:M18 family aminopeptidase n=1 Tax=Brooklawnia cerclae TaxID=349934 RepID=A0ABX0SH62_9ACTN|nr:M18 family aminopeptidase [Brooklawnia cerclae]NIH57739.1 aspartyl aminopeptidase [Brooklawnia cerclae]
MPYPDEYLASLVDFLGASPTSYHAAEAMAAALRAAGFTQLDERLPWDEQETRAFVVRDGAVAAWVAPRIWDETTGLRVFACHTDSPGLKLKPSGPFERAGYPLANVEVYGGPILHTWFDRELAVAGRVVGLDGVERLVRTEAIAIVPDLAVHLDRSQRDGLAIDAQRDLMPVFTLENGRTIEEHVWRRVGLDADAVGGYDLFLVPAQGPAVFGTDGDFLASARLDNLASVHSGLTAILRAERTNDLQFLVAFDHEEIGSQTLTGASGSLLDDVLVRLSDARSWSPDRHTAWLRRGWCLSADVTHAVHPNRPDRHDPVAWPRLNGGPVLKWSAAMRYATDAASTAVWRRACRAAGVPSQVFVNNNDVPGGSSLGPLSSTRSGLRTVDAGIAVWAMHSIRETCGVHDPAMLSQVASEFLAGA